jgi:hypothetical protein
LEFEIASESHSLESESSGHQTCRHSFCAAVFEIGNVHDVWEAIKTDDDENVRAESDHGPQVGTMEEEFVKESGHDCQRPGNVPVEEKASAGDDVVVNVTQNGDDDEVVAKESASQACDEVARAVAVKGCENLPDVDEEVTRFVPCHGRGGWDYDYDDVLGCREGHL